MTLAREALFEPKRQFHSYSERRDLASGVRMNDLQLHADGRRHFLTGERAFSAG